MGDGRRYLARRWVVSQMVAGMFPYRLHLEPRLRRQLELEYLRWTEQPRTKIELHRRLLEATNCPADLVAALRMTLENGLQAQRQLQGACGRCVEEHWQKGTPQTFVRTEFGTRWLEVHDAMAKTEQVA
jgi:hypothetical protein